MTNVVKFYTAENPDHVLEQAIGNYGAVLLIGYDNDGNLDVRAGNSIDKLDALWLIKQLEWNLLSGEYDSDWQPTNELRFVRRIESTKYIGDDIYSNSEVKILQQRFWREVEDVTGSFKYTEYEWRDVPEVEDEN